MTSFLSAPVSSPSAARRRYEATLEFRAMGTTWRVAADGVDAETLATVPALVEIEEQRFSRFRADSTLSRLNDERRTSDRTLAALIRQALRISAATAGAFDPTTGAAVIAAGYDRTFDALSTVLGASADQAVTPAATQRPNIEFDGDCVRLLGEGAVDLGGIAKGSTADRVGELLTDVGCSRWLVDAGGDILIGGRPGWRTDEPIAVELTGLTVGLVAGAVATSSTLRRAWDTPLGRMHHIISPRDARPTCGSYVLATVVAPTAAIADALATALLVDPPATVAALSAFGIHEVPAEALLIDQQGNASMTPGMEQVLR